MCKFRSSGQTCICANRIYVHSSIYAEFASRLSEKVAAFKIGDGLLSDTCVIVLMACLDDINFVVAAAPTGR